MAVFDAAVDYCAARLGQKRAAAPLTFVVEMFNALLDVMPLTTEKKELVPFETQLVDRIPKVRELLDASRELSKSTPRCDSRSGQDNAGPAQPVSPARADEVFCLLSLFYIKCTKNCTPASLEKLTAGGLPHSFARQLTETPRDLAALTDPVCGAVLSALTASFDRDDPVLVVSWLDGAGVLRALSSERSPSLAQAPSEESNGERIGGSAINLLVDQAGLEVVRYWESRPDEDLERLKSELDPDVLEQFCRVGLPRYKALTESVKEVLGGAGYPERVAVKGGEAAFFLNKPP